MSNTGLECTAFEDNRCIASGSIENVAKKVKSTIDEGSQATLLIFNDVTGEIVDIDFRGSIENVLDRLKNPIYADPKDINSPKESQTSQKKPGRPKLGVVSREVTLLPRHWEWLNSQPGGASVALRKLVDEARHANRDKDRLRNAKESVYRFLSAMAGNLPGYEETLRALYADKPEQFKQLIAKWPVDVRKHAAKISQHAFRM